MKEALIQQFTELYQKEPAATYFTPGRVNLIDGEAVLHRLPRSDLHSTRPDITWTFRSPAVPA